MANENWKFEYATQDDDDDLVMQDLELRDREIFHYERNIETYQHALATEEDELMRAIWQEKINKESLQMRISSGFHRAAKAKRDRMSPERQQAAKDRVAKKRAAFAAKDNGGR